jgi:GTPase SAR1 family protein
MRNKEDYVLKICLIGTPLDLIGKMLPKKAQRLDYLMGSEIVSKKIKYDYNIAKLILIRFKYLIEGSKINPHAYSGTSACLIAFDKAKRNTFNDVSTWYENFRNNTKTTSYYSGWLRHTKHTVDFDPEEKIPVVIVGLITDRETVTTEEGQVLADKLNLPYYETSPTDKEAISDIYRQLIRKALSRFS